MYFQRYHNKSKVECGIMYIKENKFKFILTLLDLDSFGSLAACSLVAVEKKCFNTMLPYTKAKGTNLLLFIFVNLMNFTECLTNYELEISDING